MQDEVGTITEALQRWSRRGRKGLDEGMESLYPHIERVSHEALRHERSDHTLETSEVANLIYMRLIQYTRTSWRGRRQFFSFLREKASQVLKDHARRKHALKRRGDIVHGVELEQAPDKSVDALDFEVRDFLKHLSENDPLAFEVMKRKLKKLPDHKIAEALGISVDGVEEQWMAAKLQVATLVKSK